MIFAIFEDETSITYGVAGERPITSILMAPDLDTALLNVYDGFLAIEITDPIDETLYKITWDGTTWVLTPRVLMESLATWNKTSIIANGIDAAILGPNLPNPTTINIYLPRASGFLNTIESVVETSGTFTLTTNAPGDYRIEIPNLFPNTSLTTTIIAT